MMDKLKRNLAYVFCAGLGLFNFIFLAFSYVKMYSESNVSNTNYSEGISGYELLKIWGKDMYYMEDAKFGGIMSSLMQLLVLIVGIALLAWGVLGLLKAFGVMQKFPDKLGKVESKKIAELGIFGIAGLNVLLLVFLIIFTATNSEKIDETYYGVRYTAEAGYKLSAGPFLAIIFTAGSAVALKLCQKFVPVGDSGQAVTYACAKCGKRARAADKFCSACGGEIEKKVTVKQEYVCAKCGKTASDKDKFCNSCGGEIVVKEAPPVEEAAATLDDVVQQE